MVQTSPSAQSDWSRTIKKIIKPVWTNGPLDRSGPVVLSLGADHRAPWQLLQVHTHTTDSASRRHSGEGGGLRSGLGFGVGFRGGEGSVAGGAFRCRFRGS